MSAQPSTTYPTRNILATSPGFVLQDTLYHTMRALGIWPDHHLVAHQVPAETRDLITYISHVLEGPYLLALFQLAAWLLDLQRRQA